MPIRKPQTLKRIQIDMTEKALERLQRILEDTGSISYAEVIRDSLEIREVIVRLVGEGKEIFAEDPKTKERVQLITVG